MNVRSKKLFLKWRVNNVVLVSLSTQNVASKTTAGGPFETQAQRESSDAPVLLNQNLHFEWSPIVWNVQHWRSVLKHRALLTANLDSFCLFQIMGFLCGSDDNLPTMQETWVQSLVGKIPWRRKWKPTPGLLPGKFHGQRSGTSYSPWHHKESDTTVWLTFIFTLHMKPWSTTLKCLIKCKWWINMNYYYYPGWREVILLLCHKAAFGLAERPLDFESEDVNLIISFVTSHLFYLSCAIKFPWLSCSQSV